MTPGVVAWRQLSCGNLEDAIPILHRVEIDFEPAGTGEYDIRYVSKYPQWSIVEDVVKRGQSAALVNTKWNQKPIGQDRTTRLLSSSVYPSIPIGSLLDHQHQVLITAKPSNTVRLVNTDTMEPASDLDLNRVCGVGEGWTISADPIIEDGKWTFLFAENTCKNNEGRYKIIEYGPGPDPQSRLVAIFKTPQYNKRVECFTKTNDHFIVTCHSPDSLLFLILKRRHGLMAVYQSDHMVFVKSVNSFLSPTGDDLFVDCLTSDAQPRDTLDCSGVRALRCRLTRYSLLEIKIESARFDGAAGQLNRFPTATSHYLSDTIVDYNVECAPQMKGKPYRFAYGRTLSKQSNPQAPYYNALCKIDSVERHRKPLEWTSQDCFPSPVVLIPNTVTKQPSQLVTHDHPHQPPSSLKAVSDQIVTASRHLHPTDYLHEDDLLVVSLIRDVVQERSWLVFVDGQDMVEAGRVELPLPVPLGLSAPIWVPRE